MRVWLDDTRKPPIGFTWAQTADEAIALLKTGRVEFISLDHDLAEEHYGDMERSTGFHEKTGYEVVCWMEEHNVWPAHGCAVHSFNPVGTARMLAVIARWYARRACVKLSAGYGATVMFDQPNKSIETYVEGPGPGN